MKKTLIALAAFAAASASFAQATVYGVADMYVGKTNTAAAGANVSTGAGLTNGGMSSSRLGFKVSEDMGSGMTAAVTFETGVSPDAPTATSIGDRVGTLTLANGANSLVMGRQYTPVLNYVTCSTAVGCHNQDMAGVGANNTSRASNAISYGYNAAPFSVQVMNGFNEDGTSDAGSNASSYGAIGGSYTVGDLSIGAAIESNGSSTAGKTSSNLTGLGASYNFGVVKLGVLASAVRNSGNTDGINKSGYGLSAAIPMGASAIHLTYGINTSSGAATNSSTSAYNLLYSYTMSKTTNLYSFYTNTTQDSTAGLYTGGTANATTTVFALGARKSF